MDSSRTNRPRIANGRCRYFPTVYEPTVFENYVHGTYDPTAFTLGLRSSPRNTDFFRGLARGRVRERGREEE